MYEEPGGYDAAPSVARHMRQSPRPEETVLRPRQPQTPDEGHPWGPYSHRKVVAIPACRGVWWTNREGRGGIRLWSNIKVNPQNRFCPSQKLHLCSPGRGRQDKKKKKRIQRVEGRRRKGNKGIQDLSLSIYLYLSLSVFIYLFLSRSVFFFSFTLSISPLTWSGIRFWTAKAASCERATTPRPRPRLSSSNTELWEKEVH